MSTIQPTLIETAPSITVVSSSTEALINEKENFQEIETTTSEELPSAELITTLESQFRINEADQHDLYQHYLQQYEASLEHSCANPQSRISMIPIFATTTSGLNLSNDTQEIIAVDVGGSTIRVSLIAVHKDGKYEVRRFKKWLFDESSKVVNFEFFNDLAFKINQVLPSKTKNELVKLNCGVVWSFPVDSDNKIITMGKGFTLTEEVKDRAVNALIQDSLLRMCDREVNVNSVINDSIAINLSTLLSSKESVCELTLILGTGLNSCVLINDILHNVELGFFGKLKNPTIYDLLIDERYASHKDTENWKIQEQGRALYMPTEFLCGGRYLCELVRIIISKEMMGLNVADEFALSGEFLVLFETEDPSVIIKEIKSKFGVTLSELEVSTIKRVIEIVLDRCAVYLKAALTALNDLIQSQTASSMANKKDTIEVGFIGSFLQHSKYLRDKVETESGISLQFIEDSNLIGGVVASLIEAQRVNM